jgi:large subunit ribosomal protein L2
MQSKTTFLKKNAAFQNIGLSTILKKKKFSKTQSLRTRVYPCHRRYRLVETPSFNLGVSGRVIRMEYDPYRSSGVSLVLFQNNICSYYLTIHTLGIGDTFTSCLCSTFFLEYKRGDSSIVKNIPSSLPINQIETKVQLGTTYIRAAGAYSMILRKQYSTNTAVIRMPSGKLKHIPINSFATIGVVGNTDHHNKVLFKAGQRR